MKFDIRSFRDMSCVFDNVTLGRNVTVFPYAVVGRPCMVPFGTTTRKVDVDLKPTVIGDDSIIGSGAVIYHGCVIGRKCLIGDQAKLMNDVVIGDNSLIAINVKVGYETVIGHHTRIMDLTNVAGNAILGNNIFIGPGVMMGNDNSMGREGAEYSSTGPIIEDWVTIGMNASILPNVHIGRDSIIAAGSVVTRDVPSGTVVMGSPARVVRNTTEEERRC